ncbi:MAG: hypothetical protein HYU54_10390, partial [Actinobacteria bacterium]|nr:hypothetical protein [Actinomycetota bacterium]
MARVEMPLTPAALRGHFLGREAYRRTEYIVVRRGEETAVLRVTKASATDLFSSIVDVEMLADPQETAYVSAPEVDTGVPAQMARAALERSSGARCVVVQGRYAHVNFILEPAPVPVRVVEVVPPEPAKLVDQIDRILEIAEELPPVDLRPEVIDLLALARSRPARHYLFPCRGSGAAPPGAEVAYLDERPPRSDGWVLVGCDRARQIYRHFYGEEPAYVEMCPRELVGPSPIPTLTKCCLLEHGVERDGLTVTVP